MQFGPRQRNETAAYTLLSLLDLAPETPWEEAESPLRGITPIIDFIAEIYGVRYAPNTRETIRDDTVKFFVEAGLLLRNPDQPDRPTNSVNTVYQVEPSALALLRTRGSLEWPGRLPPFRARCRGGFCRCPPSAKYSRSETRGQHSIMAVGPFSQVAADMRRRAALPDGAPGVQRQVGVNRLGAGDSGMRGFRQVGAQEARKFL